MDSPQTFVQIDEKWTQGDSHNYKDEGRIGTGRVTHKFSVYDRRNGSLLGHIKWFAPWRQYTFFGFNSVLMAKTHRELADFLDMKTHEHKSRNRE